MMLWTMIACAAAVVPVVPAPSASTCTFDREVVYLAGELGADVVVAPIERPTELCAFPARAGKFSFAAAPNALVFTVERTISTRTGGDAPQPSPFDCGNDWPGWLGVDIVDGTLSYACSYYKRREEELVFRLMREGELLIRPLYFVDVRAPPVRGRYLGEGTFTDDTGVHSGTVLWDSVANKQTFVPLPPTRGSTRFVVRATPEGFMVAMPIDAAKGEWSLYFVSLTGEVTKRWDYAPAPDLPVSPYDAAWLVGPRGELYGARRIPATWSWVVTRQTGTESTVVYDEVELKKQGRPFVQLPRNGTPTMWSGGVSGGSMNKW